MNMQNRSATPMRITLKETVDVAALEHIIEHPNLLSTLNQQQTLKLLETYRKGLDNDGTCSIYYSQASYAKGRLFAPEGRSLQQFSRQVRHTLARKIYYDIDIKNCNPTILLQLCRHKGWGCSVLRDYVEHREDRLQEVADHFQTKRESAKDLFLRLTNGGATKKWLLDNKIRHRESPVFLQAFEQELSSIRDKVWRDEQFKQFADIGRKNAAEKQVDAKASCISILLNDIENSIVTFLVDYLKKLKIKVGALVFDGIMVHREGLSQDKLEAVLRKCETKLSTDKNAAFFGTNWPIELTVKPMDEHIVWKSDGDEQTVQPQPQPQCNSDTFQDILQVLTRLRLCPAKSSLTKPVAGQDVISVIVHPMENGAPIYPCPRNNSHGNLTHGEIEFTRSTGMMKLKCTTKECNEEDFPWPETPMEPDSIGIDTLFQQITRNGLVNHADIASIVAKDARSRVAFEEGSQTWRVFDQKRGTWAKALKPTAGIQLRDCLVERLTKLAQKCSDRASLILPSGKARQNALYYNEQIQKLIAKTGAQKFLNEFRPMFEGLLSVKQQEWESHFRGYFPVANALLKFDSSSGIVSPLAYTPEMFVRQEYQTGLIWKNTDMRDTEGARMLESVFNQWWKPEERKSWLEFIAYGMSRTAFSEKYFVLEGGPGTAKSSLLKMLKQWLGDANVLARSPSLLVQKVSAARNQKDDDGNGHDSALLSFCDKAFVFLKEAEQGTVWRQGKLKDLTGDDQSGRAAHSPNITSFTRSYVIGLLTNYVPVPEDPTDTALIRREERITATNVFITDERHKQTVLSKMTPEQRENANFVMANSDVLHTLFVDKDAQSQFLSLVSEAWKRLVVDQKKQFYCAPIATERRKQYWQSVQRDQDSAVAFFSQCLEVGSEDTSIPKKHIWLAYLRWFNIEKERNNVSDGPVSETAFFKRIKDHFKDAYSVTAGKFSFVQGSESGEERVFKTDRLNGFKAIKLKDDVARFVESKSLRGSAVPFDTVSKDFLEWKETATIDDSDYLDFDMEKDWAAFPARVLSLCEGSSFDLQSRCFNFK